MIDARMGQAWRLALWLGLAVLAALVVYYAFRGYLGADLLLNFSSAFTC